MRNNKRNSSLAGIPSWGLAGITLVTTIILMAILLFLGDLLKIDDNIGSTEMFLTDTLPH